MVQKNIQKWIKGDWNTKCDVCGKKRKRSECVAAYGSGILPVIMSCRDGCADELHPLNFPPPIILDGRPVPNARPELTVAQSPSDEGLQPSFMTWGHFQGTVWGAFNNPNTTFNTNGMWTWGDFLRF